MLAIWMKLQFQNIFLSEFFLKWLASYWVAPKMDLTSFHEDYESTDIKKRKKKKEKRPEMGSCLHWIQWTKIPARPMVSLLWAYSIMFSSDELSLDMQFYSELPLKKLKTPNYFPTIYNMILLYLHIQLNELYSNG